MILKSPPGRIALRRRILQAGFFLVADTDGEVDFGEGKKNIFALSDTTVLVQNNEEVQMAVKKFWKRAWRLYQRTSIQF